MRKKVANSSLTDSPFKVIPSTVDGKHNPEFFRQVQQEYVGRTGYNLVLSDLNGSIQMGLPDCDRFPCMKSCRECREQIVSEALRTGKVCVDTCHEGYIIWGLPYAIDGQTVGGLVVIGGEHVEGKDLRDFDAACEVLHEMMLELEILPDLSHSDSLALGDGHRFVRRTAFRDLTQALEASAKPMIQAMATAEFDESAKHFKAVLAAFDNFRELPVDLIRGLVGDMVFRASHQFVAAGMDPYACYSEAGLLVQSVSKAKNVDKLIVLLRNFFERFILLSQQAPKDQDGILIDRATTYLEEHLRENLTRESVARAVGVSASHFSRLIREKKGRTFTDLLNQYRIERASKLLVRTSKTLAEIANDSGFCDQSYFSKVFRRYKDMSPAKFRSKQQL
jgi:AraC-like DNA-binding protein/ligand-binding sensor protein